MKVRTALRKGITQVKILVKHPMETGRRKDEVTGEVVPEKFIQELNCQHNGKEVFIAYLSQSVSKNPYLAFSFRGANKGDKLILKWTDSTGESETTETEIN